MAVLKTPGKKNMSLSKLGGEIPNIGDTILSPWMNDVKEDQHVPARRTFYEVVRRYFLPTNPSPVPKPDQEVFTRVVLEVRKRPGTKG